MINLSRLAMTIVCTALTACSQSTTPPPAVVVTEELRARLAVTDAADAKTDHVIAKCVLCNLQMAGKPQFAVPVGEYTVQLCSAGCRDHFSKDPAKALLALPVVNPPSMSH